MRLRVIASALLAVVVAACGGDDKVTAPQLPSRIAVSAAIGTDPVSGAAIETNQDDYLPGEIVHVVGRGWAPNETVKLYMSEAPDTHEDVSMDVTADSSGSFSVHFYDVQQYDLGVTFTMTATGQTSGSKATATFTDGRVINSFTLNGSPTVTVSPSTSISANVLGQVNGNSNNTVGSIGLKAYLDGTSSTSASVVACFNVTPDIGPSTPSNSIPFNETFTFVGPTGAGAYDVDVTIYSDNGCSVTNGSDTQTRDKGITVQSANTAPTLNAIGNKAVNEGSALTFTASASDTDTPTQTLTFSLVGAPAGATINSSSGAFSWTPTDGPAQTATFTVKVTDNGSTPLSDEESITVTVNNVAPTATFNTPASVAAATPFSISLTAPVEPSAVDAGSLKYAFDCGSGYGALSSANSVTCPGVPPTSVTVKGKVQDKDGGSTEYTASVAVNNVPPTADAGGTNGAYSGNEGSAIPISGSGTDPDGGTVTFAWSVQPNDGHCSIASPASASTTVTCNDNGTWTLSLTVTDDEGAASAPATATLSVANVAPTAMFNAPSPVNEGSPISLSLTAPVEPSTVDAASLKYSFDCGAGYGSPSATNTASCPTTDNGARTVKGKVLDKDGGFTEYAATVTINNVAPTATFNAPSSVDEGSAINLSLTGAADPSSVDMAAGFEYAFDCGAGYDAYSSTSTKSCPTADNETRTVRGKIKDKDGGETAYTKYVTVKNVAPGITLLNVPTNPLAAGPNNVTVSWTFDDPGSADTWTCAIDWDNGAGEQAAMYSPTKTCNATTSLPAGIYTVTVRVTDDDGGTGTAAATTYIVVYDPNAGFVTGGGWINSPAGAYVAAPSLGGKATFGFVSKYKKGQSTPDGNTEFQFHAAGMNFKSNVYEWLVVSGPKAQFKGTGTINGSGNYGFMLTAIDGQLNGGGGADKFRIKIWDKNNGDAVVYDNQILSGDTVDPTTLLGGGSINIQAK